MTKKPEKKYHIKIKEKTQEYYVLSLLEEIGGGMIKSLFPPQYPEAQIWRAIFDFDGKRALKQKEKRAFSTIISRLNKKGQIAKRGSTNQAIWELTEEGKFNLSYIKTKTAPSKDGLLRIVLFDIPEKYRAQRTWLRHVLINNNYQLLQRSAWIGQNPFPEDEYKKLRNKKIFRYVHIFTIKDPGTLKDLDWDNPY